MAELIDKKTEQMHTFGRLTEFESLLLTLYLSTPLFQAITFTRIRYRLPYDFLLIAIVALFIGAIHTRFLLSKGSKTQFQGQVR